MTPQDRVRAAHGAGIDLPVFLYDGGCGFCRRWAEWLAARSGLVRFVPFQEVDHEALGLSEEELRSASYLVDGSGGVHGASDGFAVVLRQGPWAWATLGRFLQLPVVRLVAWLAYRAVARNRHRLAAPR